MATNSGSTRAAQGLGLVERPAPSVDIRADAEFPPLIPPGTYDAILGAGQIIPMGGGQVKLKVEFTVMVPNAEAEFGHRNERLFRYYNLKATRSRDGRKDGYRTPVMGDYVSDYIALTGARPRLDRVRPSAFAGVAARVVVRTVTKNRKQQARHPLMHYSVVDRVVDRIAGGVQP